MAQTLAKVKMAIYSFFFSSFQFQIDPSNKNCKHTNYEPFMVICGHRFKTMICRKPLRS